MGANRFMLFENNLVVAVTDMSDHDDRDKLQDKQHYSKTHVRFGIYGLDKLDPENKKANEDNACRLYIDRFIDQIVL